MESKDLRQWRSFLSFAEEGGNQYLQQITESENLDETIAFIDKNIEALSQEGINSENIHDTFASADFREEYAIYKFLSPYVHVNIRILFESYFVFKNGSHHYAGPVSPKAREIETQRGIISEFMVRSAQYIHPILKLPPENLVLKAREELNAIRPDGGEPAK